MTTRRLHRIVGAVLVLPFIGWAVTGFIFFLKPGYSGAYEIPRIKTISQRGDNLGLPSQVTWLEYRVLTTAIGRHLLVRDENGWRHLDPSNFQEKPEPGEDDLKRLLQDAFTANPKRYGVIQVVNGLSATTDTGVRVTLNWRTMSLSQQGNDTKWINRLYSIHYIQWTGVALLDRILGLTALLLLIGLTILGVRLLFKR